MATTTKEYKGPELVRLALAGLAAIHGNPKPHEAELIVRARDLRRGQSKREVVLRTHLHDDQPLPDETSIRTVKTPAVKRRNRRAAA
jgi:hypothetical protein